MGVKYKSSKGDTRKIFVPNITVQHRRRVQLGARLGTGRV